MTDSRITTVIIDFKHISCVNNVIGMARSLHKSEIQIVVWNSSGQNVSVPDANLVFQSESVFLSSSQDALLVLQDTLNGSAILIADSTITLSWDDVDRLNNKFHEYGSEVIVCTSGMRLFPHVSSPNMAFHKDNGNSWRVYDERYTDRRVHLMCLRGGLCVMSKENLVNILQKSTTTEWDESDFLIDWPEFRASFVGGEILRIVIWKIRYEIRRFQSIDIEERIRCCPEIDGFYRGLVKIDWPKSFTVPILFPGIVKDALPIKGEDVWLKGFGGFNVSAQCLPLDLQACRYYGASVVRYGAVNDASDLSFMVFDDEDDADWAKMIGQIEISLPQLRKSIIAAAEIGLKVILTFTDVPGRRRKADDFRLLQPNDDAAAKFACFWKRVVAGIVDLREHVAGYDLINEPYLPDDLTKCFYDDMCSTYAQHLRNLYERTTDAIREIDKETTVILESPFWASPRCFEGLIPVDDLNTVYSFHFYYPFLYTNRMHNSGQYEYPGRIPLWKNVTHESCCPLWNKSELEKLVEPVIEWQHRYKIPNNRVFVGEFGVCREMKGARQYLADLVDIWTAKGWSWCLFSFRDDEWDAMDYELGTDIANQLDRQHTDLIDVVSKRMHRICSCIH